VIGAVVAGVVLGAAIVALVGAMLFTESGRDLVRTQAKAALQAGGVEVDVDRVGGVPGRMLELEGVRIAFEGRTIVRLPHVRIAYAPFDLLRGRIGLRRVTLTKPRVRVERRDGEWQLPKSTAGGTTWRFPPVRISRLRVIDGRVDLHLENDGATRRVAVTDLDATLAVHLGFRRQRLRIATLTFEPRGIPLPPVSAAGTVGLEGDAVCVADGAVATPGTRLRVSGCVEPGEGVLAHLAIERLDAGELRALWPASPLTTTVAGTADATGHWKATRVTLGMELGGARVGGHAMLDLGNRPVRYGAVIEAAELDPARIVTGGWPARLNGQLRVVGSQAAVDRWWLVLEPSEIAGRPLTMFRARGRSDRAGHVVRARAASPAGTATVRGHVMRDAHDESVRYELDGHAHIARMDALFPETSGHGRLRVVGSAAGTGPRPEVGELRLTVTDADALGVWIDRATIESDLRSGHVVRTGAAIDGPGLSATVQGSVDLADLTVDASLTATSRLQDLVLRTDAALAGHVEAEATLRGPLTGAALDATLRGQAVAAGGVHAAHAQLTIDGRALGGGAPHSEGELALSGMWVAGLTPRDARGAVAWSRGDAGEHVEVVATARQGDAVTERVRVAFSRAGGTIVGELQELELLSQTGPPWALASPASFALDDGLRMESLTLRAARQQILFKGRVARGGANDASITLDRVHLEPVCTALGVRDCGGRMSGSVHVGGTAALPALGAHLAVDQLKMSAVDYGRLDIDALYADRLMSIEGHLRTPRAGTVDAEARVPIDLAWTGQRHDVGDQPLSGVLRASDLDLTFLPALAANEIRTASGRARVDLRLAGSSRAPQVSGRAVVEDGSLQLSRLGSTYEDIAITLDMAADRVQVTNLHARAGKGTVRGTGGLDLSPGAGRSFVLTLNFEKFLALKHRGNEAALNGALRFAGTPATPTLTGTIEVERAVLRLPPFIAPTEPVAYADPTIEVVGMRQSLEPATQTSTPESTLDDRLRLDVAVRLPGNAWIRRHDANVEVSGDLRLTKAPHGTLQTHGSFDSRRGWYAFQGRRFTLRAGTVTFPESGEEPSVDITGAYRADEYTVVAHVKGPSSKPELDLWSEPALDQADILSVLLFGKPVGRLNGEQAVSLQEQTVGLAGGYAVGQLGASVRDALGLDTLDVELPQGADGDGQFRVGRHITRDVFVSFAHQFGSSIAEVVSAEYAITPRISIRGSTSTLGNTAVDFFLNHRY
jgi:autotransporter translocation and assembly factor TamB